MASSPGIRRAAQWLRRLRISRLPFDDPQDSASVGDVLDGGVHRFDSILDDAGNFRAMDFWIFPGSLFG